MKALLLSGQPDQGANERDRAGNWQRCSRIMVEVGQGPEEVVCCRGAHQKHHDWGGLCRVPRKSKNRGGDKIITHTEALDQCWEAAIPRVGVVYLQCPSRNRRTWSEAGPHAQSLFGDTNLSAVVIHTGIQEYTAPCTNQQLSEACGYCMSGSGS